MTTTIRHACGCATTQDHDNGSFEQVTCSEHASAQMRTTLRLVVDDLGPDAAPQPSSALLERFKRMLRNLP